MKLKKWPMMAVALIALTACSNDSDDAPEAPTEETGYVVSFDNTSVVYNADGVWDFCYSLDAPALVFDKFVFSHYVQDWDGYLSWNGFCPSKSTDTNYYPGEWWSGHDCSSITGGGVDGPGTPYMVGYWATWEVIGEEDPTDASCRITCEDGAFAPKSVCVTLTTWSYYDMKEGDMYGNKFGDGDWCHLEIYGFADGQQTGSVVVDLADGSDVLSTWKKVDLTKLGVVDSMVFAMSSSDTGEWGMNNAAYFCLDKFTVD